MNNIAIIGDIHGDIAKLNSLLDKLPINLKLIFVGDYVNKGKSSKLVISRLIELSKYRNCIFLIGNHEIAMMNYIDFNDFSRFALLGGIPNILSYVEVAKSDVHNQYIKSIPNDHIHFLKSLNTHFENEYFFVSHSGINIDHPNSRKDIHMCNNSIFEEQIQSKHKTKIKVFGHFVQKTRIPYQSDYNICIDTGCGMEDGRLTALLLPSMQFVSS